MYGLRVNITPEDIMERLCDEDKAKFNQCVFTDVVRERDGTITINCVVFNDPDPYVGYTHRQRYGKNTELTVNMPMLDTKR